MHPGRRICRERYCLKNDGLYRQNVITVYDWEEHHIRTLPITVSGEPENLSQVGGSLYVASAAGGAQLTRIELRNR